MKKSTLLVSLDLQKTHDVNSHIRSYEWLFDRGNEWNTRPVDQELTNFFKEVSKNEALDASAFSETPMLNGTEEVRYFRRGMANLWVEFDPAKRSVGYFDMALIDGAVWTFAPNVFESLELPHGVANWYTTTDLVVAKVALLVA